MSDVFNFTRWKQENCSAKERLTEVLHVLERHPEDMKHLICIWIDEKGMRQSCCDSDVTILQAVGMLELTKIDFGLAREKV